MTARRAGDTLTIAVAVAISAISFYFGMAGLKNGPFFLSAYACFLLIAIKRWLGNESFTIQHWHRFYIALFLVLFALTDLVRALMNPVNGWKSARLWIFGVSWLALAVYQLHVFYTGQKLPETQ